MQNQGQGDDLEDQCERCGVIEFGSPAVRNDAGREKKDRALPGEQRDQPLRAPARQHGKRDQQQACGEQIDDGIRCAFIALCSLPAGDGRAGRARRAEKPSRGTRARGRCGAWRRRIRSARERRPATSSFTARRRWRSAIAATPSRREWRCPRAGTAQNRCRRS